MESFSTYSVFTVGQAMLMTLKDPAPSLTEEGNRTNFSKGLKELVTMCLKKNPAERPSAAKLLEHRFIKSAKSTDHFARHVIEKLQPLGERVRLLKEKEAKRRADSENENKGQKMEGGSGWDYSDVAPVVDRPPSRNSGAISTGNPIRDSFSLHSQSIFFTQTVNIMCMCELARKWREFKDWCRTSWPIQCDIQ